MHSKQPKEYTDDFSDKAALIIEKIRVLKNNYENCLLLDKEFHELKSITLEINRNKLEYNCYMNARSNQEDEMKDITFR